MWSADTLKFSSNNNPASLKRKYMAAFARSVFLVCAAVDVVVIMSSSALRRCCRRCALAARHHPSRRGRALPSVTTVVTHEQARRRLHSFARETDRENV